MPEKVERAKRFGSLAALRASSSHHCILATK